MTSNSKTLQEQALAAWEERRAEEEKERIEREEKWIKAISKFFEQDFGISPDRVVVTEPYKMNIYVDDMKFLRHSGKKEYQLEGVCSVCNTTCWSRGFKDMAGLGEMLAHFGPSAHTCKMKGVRMAEHDFHQALVEFLDSGE